ncbi:MAG: cysteine--tRNA ligase, partial [Candidatus Woesearchaeota archaeon]
KGYKVKYVSNITDVDDKTIRNSQKEKIPLSKYTEKYIKAYFEDLETLNILKADVYPRATEHIKEMVEMIKKLLEKGIAYKSNDGCIYYSISKFKDYGKLAHLDPEQLKAGASGRVLSDEYDKASVHDFALWKAWTPDDGDVFWETEIGKGRPGWHIECSAMSSKYLGESFDIHGGGVDLIFPHHQNEIAQSEGASGKKFVKYWVHNDWLLVDGQKMSKSLGNFYTLRDILAKGYHPLAARYFFLSTHYRQQFNFTFQGLEASRNALQRIWDFVKKLDEVKGKEDCKKTDALVKKLKKGFEKALDDDLDIAKALAVLFELVRQGNILLPKLSEENAKKIKRLLVDFDKVLGFIFPKEEKLPDEIMKLIEEREHARAIKNWARSDEIREELKKKGILIEDTPQGVRWKKA